MRATTSSTPPRTTAHPTLVPEQVLNVRHSQVDQYALLRVYSQELVPSVRNLDKLTIAAMNGVAIQLGLSLALACDYCRSRTAKSPVEPFLK